MKFNIVWQYLKNSLYQLLLAIDRILWEDFMTDLMTELQNDQI